MLQIKKTIRSMHDKFVKFKQFFRSTLPL